MRKRLLLTCAVAALGLSAGSALAQDAVTPVNGSSPDTSDEAMGLAEIVVTARRVEERVQEIPLAITAISGDALRAAGIREIRDLSAAAPNLNVQAGNTGSGTAALSIRGQNASTVSLAVDSAVGLYIDGINIPRTYGVRSALVDIARVEVLRGPQGTLYGRNTTGGAVSFYTNAPTDELGGSLQLSTGNYGAVGATGILNVPIAEGLNTRFVALTTDTKGYGDKVLAGRRLATEDATYLRGKVAFYREAFRADFSADYFDIDTQGAITRLGGLMPPSSTSPYGGGNAARAVAIEMGLISSNSALTALQTSNPALFNSIMQQASAELGSYVGRGDFHDDFGRDDLLAPPQERVNGATFSLNAEYDLNDELTFRSITGYRKFDADNATDNDGTPYRLSDNYVQTNDKFFSQEAQLLGSMGSFSWVLGGFYSNESGHALEQSRSLVALSPTVNVTISEGDIKSSSWAAFGQGNWDITDALRLTVGARWTEETKTYLSQNRSTTGCTIGVSYRDDGVTCFGTFENTFSDPTYLASLDYKFSEGLLFYTKYSRGFRGGGQNTRASGANPRVYEAFAPETLTEYELGTKMEFLDRRIRFNVAAFYDEYEDIQRSVTVLVNPATNAVGQIQTNAARATVPGFEAELSWRVMSGLTLSGSYGLIDPEYKEFVDLSGDRSGEPWPAPLSNYSLNARYDHRTSLGQLSTSVTWAWQDKTNASPSASQRVQLTQDAYGLLSARVGLEVDAWNAEISLWGRNLLNEKYFQSGINLESIGFNRRGPGDPRTYGVQFTKRFGTP